MKLELFLAADYANLTGDGKLNVMGIFSDINARSFPTRLPSMHLVIRLLPELGEWGVSREVFVKLMDEDGNEIVSLSGQVEAPKSSGGRRTELNVILGLKDVIFPKPGYYQFVLLVDKDHKGDLTLYVNQLESSKQSQG